MSSPDPYDLLVQPVFPVRWADHVPEDARPDAVGLRELFARAHDISALAIPLPPALSALYRVLYALTARITRLDRSDDWHEDRYAILDTGRFSPQDVSSYFDSGSRAGRFRLFDPDRPFLQDPRLATECDKSAGVNKLVTTRPSGSNHSWFQHAADARPAPVEPAEAFLHLLVWRYYGPSGRCSSRSVRGVKEANSTAGPLRTALSYHPLGENLFETLLAGLAEPDPSRIYDPDTDLCPWERDELPDPLSVKGVVTGPLSSLTARTQHAVFLVPDDTGTMVRDAYITWAFRERIPREDDYLIWQVSQAGNAYARYADSQRALWRDLDALLLDDPPGQESTRPPVFRTAVELSEKPLRVQALGIHQEGQAKDTQLVSSSTPPVLHLAQERDPERARLIGLLRLSGEIAGGRLARATKQAWASFSNARRSEDCAWSAEAAARYWPAAEVEFWRRLEDRRFDGAARAFRTLAEHVYDQVTDTAAGSMRGARARENARIELYGGRRKTPAGAKSTGRNNSTETEE
ncbi:type I-E CRISPR-associated protein Cse1/CasA [Streptomyces olivoreticuli]|uniref:type I-E CRISPR-associated protein Cse1/CasA n=1 Tax=Streptomyces olivoreticuli TaxID=68246 RepID=UPI000E21EFAC|nr:type I-E CRISPR-associated protein Cse1/CasA [Streptomyces olivoreticuli]